MMRTMHRARGIRAVGTLLWVRASIAFIRSASAQFKGVSSLHIHIPRISPDVSRSRCFKQLSLGLGEPMFSTSSGSGGLNAANSHLDLAHTIWQQVIRPCDVVVDATCGNGLDSLALANLALTEESGKLYCFDIQENALQATKQRLSEGLSRKQLDRVQFLHQSHESFPDDLQNVTTIAYNLGYLPKGDKNITTTQGSTLQSLQKALRIVRVGGLISILCYVGHPQGESETLAVQSFVTSLDKYQWRVFEHRPLNRPVSPILITLFRLA